MLTQAQVLQKYLSFDYRIRYLADGVPPSDLPEHGTVFAVENGLAISQGLACDPLRRPLLFKTEAEAFAYRHGLGLKWPVLAFYEEEPEVDETETLGGDGLDAYTLAEIAAYIGE